MTEHDPYCYSRRLGTGYCNCDDMIAARADERDKAAQRISVVRDLFIESAAASFDSSLCVLTCHQVTYEKAIAAARSGESE